METKEITVKDIMTKDAICVRPEMSIVEAAKVLIDHNFNGAPVVDESNKLVGILTEYDLISKGSSLHLPTFQFLLRNLQIFKKDKEHFAKEVEDVVKLQVKDVMNNDPLTLLENSTYEEAVAAFREHHRVNPIPVIDKERNVLGVISRIDILKPLGEIS